MLTGKLSSDCHDVTDDTQSAKSYLVENRAESIKKYNSKLGTIRSTLRVTQK